MPNTYGPYPNSKGESVTYTFLSDKKAETTYVVVSDTNSKVVLSTENRYEAQKLANKIRACGGAATVFKETKL